MSEPAWQIIEGDCLEVMRGFADKSVDHVITDPPYEAEAHTKARRSLSGGGTKRKYEGRVRAIDAPLEISFSAITEPQREACGDAFGRLARRWVVAFCQAEAIAAWRRAFGGGGLDWVRAGVWLKPNGAPQFTGDRPGQGFESVAIAHAKGRKSWNGGGKHAVWSHATEKIVPPGGGSLKSEHPTTKPLDLVLELVSDFTDPGELVLDPFCGSGTTGVACLRLGRRFCGIEKNPAYAALARERLEAESKGLSLRDARAGQLPMFGS